MGFKQAQTPLSLGAKKPYKNRKWLLKEVVEPPVLASSSLNVKVKKKFQLEICGPEEYCTMASECHQHIDTKDLKFCSYKKVCCDSTGHIKYRNNNFPKTNDISVCIKEFPKEDVIKSGQRYKEK